MGLLGILTGRRELRQPAADRLFAITTAAVSFETAHGISSSGAAAIVFQSLQTGDFHSIVADAEQVVRATAADSATEVQTDQDSYGYSWLILRGSDIDSLAVGINAVSGALEAGGYGERLLCAAFAFRDGDGRPLYWIYNYKRGSFYPFAPAPGARQQRDNERELVLRAQAGSELPVEPELGRWFPLWGIPL
ncbi:MAG: PspA-associated protein PspAB [Solirubrobacteraceae bacterium]